MPTNQQPIIIKQRYNLEWHNIHDDHKRNNKDEMTFIQQRLNAGSLLSVVCIAAAAAAAAAVVRVEALSSLPPPKRLQQLLEYHSQDDVDVPLLLPCCYDGLTARLVARAGFDATFMTGFGYVFPFCI